MLSPKMVEEYWESSFFVGASQHLLVDFISPPQVREFCKSDGEIDTPAVDTQTPASMEMATTTADAVEQDT
jgi:hypothetical protein